MGLLRPTAERGGVNLVDVARSPLAQQTAQHQIDQASVGKALGPSLADDRPHGLPASASQDRRGSSVSHPGTWVKRLADRRSNSSRCAACRLSGKAVSRLPASISFCSAGHWPKRSGKLPSALSVKINQRKAAGSAAGGTC